MDFAALVVREGDRVTASGRLIRDHTGDWFEPPMPVALMLVTPRRARPSWRGAVRVTGADFDHLTDRFEDGGSVEGSASLTGIWSAGQLRAEHQTSPRYEHRVLPRWETPPCPAPPGGWPQPPGWRDGDENLHFDLGDLEDTGAAVAVTVFRPSQGRAVLVIVAADPDVVKARLRPQLGALLCVVPSRWTKAELDAVRDQLDARHDAWNIYLWGSSTGEDGQACVTAQLTRVLPEIARWADSLPRGILSLDPWLRRTDLAAS